MTAAVKQERQVKLGHFKYLRSTSSYVFLHLVVLLHAKRVKCVYFIYVPYLLCQLSFATELRLVKNAGADLREHQTLSHYCKSNIQRVLKHDRDDIHGEPELPNLIKIFRNKQCRGRHRASLFYKHLGDCQSQRLAQKQVLLYIVMLEDICGTLQLYQSVTQKY